MHVPREIAEQAGSGGSWEPMYAWRSGALNIGSARPSVVSNSDIAVPTTYAGSEMTPDLAGMTTGGLKQTGRDPACCPGR